jgi:VanZ family protein
MRFILYRLPVLLYMGLIFYASSGPISSPTVQAVPDYVLHIGAYAVLYVLAFRGAHEGLRFRAHRGGYWLPAIITVLYGATDEFHQSFVPGRDASWLDLLSDSAGALAGAVLVRLAARYLESAGRPRPARESGIQPSQGQEHLTGTQNQPYGPGSHRIS